MDMIMVHIDQTPDALVSCCSFPWRWDESVEELNATKWRELREDRQTSVNIVKFLSFYSDTGVRLTEP